MWGALATAAIQAIGQWYHDRQAKRQAGRSMRTMRNDLIQAGYNPALAYQLGGSPMPSLGNIGEAAVSGFQRGTSAKAQRTTASAEVREREAATALLEQQRRTEEQRTTKTGVEANKLRSEYNFLERSFDKRLDEVGARVESFAKGAGLSSALASKAAKEAQQLEADTQLKGALKELYTANAGIAGLELEKQKGYKVLFGEDPKGFKRYLTSFLGSAIGSSAKALAPFVP